MCKISIIVPVYNTQDYIEACLTSLISQTLSDIEILCVDDCSVDESRAVLERMAQMDNRIRIIAHPKNMGTLQARKSGVSRASGEFLLFVDSDDSLEPQACANLYRHMCESGADLIQFGTHLIPAKNVSKEMLQWVSNFLTPYVGKLSGRDILKKCFLEDQFDFNITDKIWKKDLCRRAFDKVENLHLIASEDRYVFFLLAFYAESYLGLSDEKYYNYNLGIGVTGGDTLTFEQFQKRCSGEQAAEAVRKFLINEDALDTYREEYERFSNLILWDCVHCWHTKLEKTYRKEGFQVLKNYWSPADIVGAIGRMFFEDSDRILEDVYSEDPAQKKSIAIYYRYFGYEPMNSYIEQYTELCERMGYAVILYTDEDADFSSFAKKVTDRIVSLPNSSDANWDQYLPRAKTIEKELENQNPEVVLYVSSSSHLAWLDTLLIRSLGIPVIYPNEAVKLEQLELQKQLNEKNTQLQQLTEEIDDLNRKFYESRNYKLGNRLLRLPRKISACWHAIRGKNSGDN